MYQLDIVSLPYTSLIILTKIVKEYLYNIIQEAEFKMVPPIGIRNRKNDLHPQYG